MSAPTPGKMPDRQPVKLLEISTAAALDVIATWLEDCEQHLDLGRTGGLPAAPFQFAEAWVVVRLVGIKAGIDIETQRAGAA